MITLHTMSARGPMSGGLGLTLRYGYHATPFGDCLLAVTDRGVCHLAFHDPGKAGAALETLRTIWPQAVLEEDMDGTTSSCAGFFSTHSRTEPIHLLAKGTPFQLNVWQALLRIPEGCVTTYGAIASDLGAPQAYRAVGSALGRNTIAYLIPCHRVIPKTGTSHSYRWGAERKQAILAWETARVQAHDV